jgi:hypothetical protein
MHTLMLVSAVVSTPAITKIGAFCFGAVIGWYAYFLNRWRKDIVIGDLATVIAAIGGAAVLKLFPATTVLFGWYGVGLAVGFFAYFSFLLLFVAMSNKYTLEFFLVPPEGQHPLGGRSDGPRPGE